MVLLASRIQAELISVSLAGIYNHAFITEPGGAGIRDIGTLGVSEGSRLAINSSGQVVGSSRLYEGDFRFYGFITGPNGTGIRSIELAGSTSMIEPAAINDRGEVTGKIISVTDQQFRTEPNGLGVTPLGTLNGKKPGGTSRGSAINAQGVVVGASTLKPGSRLVAALTDEKGVMVNLNRLVVNLPTGIELTKAGAINRYGQIAAQGTDGRIYIVCPKENCKVDSD